MFLRTLGLGLLLTMAVLVSGCHHRHCCCTPCCTPCCNSCSCGYSPAPGPIAPVPVP
jgi:hypothetical protein